MDREGADIATVRTVRAEQWDEAELSDYQVVVLDDVPAPTESQAAALERFVFAGGGLLIAPGPAARTNQYNRLLYREEGGLLPALLQPAVSQAGMAIEPATVDSVHPMLSLFAGRVGSLSAQVQRYVPITAPTRFAHVLASYTSGDAFLIESPYGRGRVVLVSNSLGPAWSTLPLTSVYLPLMQSMTRYLAGASVLDRNLSAGEELAAVFDPPAPGTRGVVIRPDGTRDTCDVATIDQRSEARYARTDLAGLYTIRVGPRGSERSMMFAVAPPAEESVLAAMTEEDWRRLEKEMGFTRLSAEEGALAATLSGTRGSEGEYWMAALAGVMALLVVELGLAWWWTGEDDKVTRRGSDKDKVTNTNDE
jgi:hypothetical protein